MSADNLLLPSGSARVSVITPFFNNEAFLAEAIDSVIAQTFGDWEYLLVDDGSGPEATAIAKQYAAQYPDKIRYLEHDQHLNRGISATRNLGVRHARGEYIAFLDSDDVWLPEKLAGHVTLLDARQEVGMVCGTTIEWRSWSNGSDIILPTGERQDVVIHPPEAACTLYPLGPARAPSFSDVVFRAHLLRELGGFEEKFTGIFDDQVFLLKIYLSTPVYFSSVTSNKYRQHPSSTSATARQLDETLQGKLFFLQWLEGYLKTIGAVDPGVRAILRRALRPYRHPRLEHFISVSKSARDEARRVRSKLRIRKRFRSALHRVRSPKPMPLILMYHRIADRTIDPWGLAVSPTHFEEQLGVLARTRHPLSLVDFVDRLISGTLPSNAVAVTFDDGYLDNLTVAKPLLAAAEIPATVFLATGYTGRSAAFWWDELAALILLAKKAPQAFEFTVGHCSMRFNVDTEFARNADDASSATPRTTALATMWKALQPLDDDGRSAAMARLRSIFTLDDHQQANLGRPMTSDEVRTIAADRLVTLGAHTVTHPMLSRLPPAASWHEVADSKMACEKLVGSTISAFSYPYGDFDSTAQEAVRAAGFKIAVSIQSGPATRLSDVFAMPRLHVRDMGGDAFDLALHSSMVSH
jgi:glycosyltransferase involved in cell wall biosynthesis/peptidoglycan/xylan/chitin deacetylase (PgdA/CDA1 family)